MFGNTKVGSSRGQIATILCLFVLLAGTGTNDATLIAAMSLGAFAIVSLMYRRELGGRVTAIAVGAALLAALVATLAVLL